MRWLVEQMRCAGRLKANGRRPARPLVASAWSGRHVPRLPYAGGTFLADLLERSIAAAARERSEEAMRTEAEAALSAARASVRALTRDFESFVDAAHRDEIARAEQQMRVEAWRSEPWPSLASKPRCCWPNMGRTSPCRCLRVRTAPFRQRGRNPSLCRMCERQEKRLRAAERELGVLGRVNPLPWRSSTRWGAASVPL